MLRVELFLRMRVVADQKVNEVLDLDTIRQRCDKHRQAKELYERFAQIGLNYGESFRVAQTVWNNETEVLGELKLSDYAGNI